MSQPKLPKISYNYYWVLPDADYDHINGLYVYDNFDPAKRYSICGKVYGCPKIVLNPKQLPIHSLGASLPEVLLRRQRLQSSYACEHHSEVVIKEGDVIWFNYNQHFSDIKLICIEISRKPLMLFHRDQIYMLEREGQKEMCNGYIWIEQIPYSEEETTNVFATNVWQSKNKAKLGVGIIRQVGQPNAAYRDEPNKYQDFSIANVGDKIYFRNTAPSAEWQSHQELNKNGQLPYLKIQRKDILAYVL